jgi:NAD(P)H dehydrogenase (quinone)
MDATNPMNPSIEKIDHGYTEAYIQRTGLDYIFLRNSQYAEAMVSVYDNAVSDGSLTIANNMGAGRVAYISRKDCAVAAAYAVANTLLHKEILNINGLENLTVTELIEIGNKVSKHNVKYHELNDEELYQYFDNLGVPRTTDGEFDKNSPWQFSSDGMVTFGEAIRLGDMSIHTKDFIQLTGRKPLSVEHMFHNSSEFQVGQRNSVDK